MTFTFIDLIEVKKMFCDITKNMKIKIISN